MPLDPLPVSESLPRRFLLSARALAVSSFLFPTLIFLNGAQTLSLVVKPFSSKAFRKANRWMANLWWGWCALGAEKINKTQFLYHGDEVPARENAVVLMNHQEMTDIAVLFSFARAKKRLGDLKWFVKDIVKYVPGVGWGMLFLDCLYVKRNWTSDKEYVHRVFDRILKNRVPLWLMIFAEGTRISPKKLRESQAFAQKTGRNVLNHVMVPRSRGFVATVQSLRDHLDAVYDVTIGYVEGVPTLWQWMRGCVQKVHLHVKRFPMEVLPESDSGLADWLMERFEEKDRLLEGYYSTGRFA